MAESGRLSAQVNADRPTWAVASRSDRVGASQLGSTMNRPLATLALGALGVAVAIAAACQAYDFEPVKPLSVGQDSRSVPLAFNRPKPNLMILEDKSGSMANPVTSGGPSKMTVLKQVMGDFLTGSPTVARVGLTKFPGSASSCAASTSPDVLSQVPPGSAGD